MLKTSRRIEDCPVECPECTLHNLGHQQYKVLLIQLLNQEQWRHDCMLDHWESDWRAIKIPFTYLRTLVYRSPHHH